MKDEVSKSLEARASVDNGAPAIARDSGAGEPAELAVLVAKVGRQVAQSVERDKVLDAGKQLEGKVSLRTARSLAVIWKVQQKRGGANRTVSDMTEEIHTNVTIAAVRLLQTQEERERGAEEREIKNISAIPKNGHPREPIRSKCKTRSQRLWNLGQDEVSTSLQSAQRAI